MKYASALRPILAFALVASPFVVVACSTPDSHPPIIGDCAGANCVAGSSAAGSGSGGGTGSDGSTTGGGDGSSVGTDSGTGGDDGSTIGSE